MTHFAVWVFLSLQGPPQLALEHRPALWYQAMRALVAGEAGGGGGGLGNGFEAAARLPEEGLEQVEPLAFD